MTADVSTPILPSLERARALLGEGRAAEAQAVLRTLVDDHPRDAETRYLLGRALQALGDGEGAERELYLATTLDDRQPALHTALGAILALRGKELDAEAAYRRALSLEPQAKSAIVGLAELLLAQSRLAEAQALTASAVAARSADLAVWTVHARALKALGRFDEAIAAYQHGAAIAPRSGVAEHNLAGVLGDVQRFAESDAAARRAFAKGLDAPETWLVHARALMGQARFAEAEDAYREAIKRRMAYAEAHEDLAQLVWMRTEDLAAASEMLDAAIKANAQDSTLHMKKARLLEFAGDRQGAYGALCDVLSATGLLPGPHLLAAQMIMPIDPERGLAHASQAYAMAPEALAACTTLCEANLALGRGEEAAKLALALHERAPLDQHAICLLATAWRLNGDPRYGALFDYGSLVSGNDLDTPDGWSSLDAYLVDLTESLSRLHPLLTHPVGQSLRNGTQTLQGLDLSDDPVIRAFFRAIDGPIRRHLQALGTGEDPLRVRNTGGYRFNGVWSVRLRPDGYHVNHVHPMGWISSACHIALPPAIEHGREGWLKFGEPGVPTRPELSAEHWVKPTPGRLVLFPSYMWHGTAPFTGDERRLTIAFDLVPAEASA